MSKYKNRFTKEPNTTCEYCKVSFYARDSEIKRGIKYCSRECYLSATKNSVEKICEHCGKPFKLHMSETKRQHNRGRFCSIQCYYDRIKITKEKQHKVVATCKQCGKSYEVARYKKDNTSYCSYACRDEWRRINLRGENHWQYKPKIKINCHVCGKEFFVNEYRLQNGNPKYCSYECMGKDRITTGGSFGKYCEKFNREFKHRVKEFFNNTCVLCGKKFPSGPSRLCVHHVHYDKGSCCDGVEYRDFVTLCNSCHCKTTMGDREYWIKYFEDFLAQNYGGKCYYTKEEYEQIIKQK